MEVSSKDEEQSKKIQIGKTQMSRFNKNKADSVENTGWVNAMWCMDVNDSFAFPKGKTTYAAKAVIRENVRSTEEKAGIAWDRIKTNNGGLIVRVR